MTSRVQYYAAQSLDGYIAESDDGLGWLMGYDGSYAGDGPAEPGPLGEGNSYERFYEGVGALVSGSATYEFLLRHGGEWPYPGKLYRVLSSRDLPVPEGADVRVGPGEVAEVHAELAEAAGDRNVWIVGGGGVASDFAEAGLLDEVIVTVVPVVLGEGKRLFDRPLPRPMRLTGTTVYESGMTELRLAL